MGLRRYLERGEGKHLVQIKELDEYFELALNPNPERTRLFQKLSQVGNFRLTDQLNGKQYGHVITIAG